MSVVLLKRMVLSLSMLFFLILVLPNIHAVPVHPVAYLLITPVTLDGKYTSASEWNDTTELPLEVGIETVAYFRAKYDSNYLYTLWDYIECKRPFTGNSSTTAGYPNQAILYFDPLNMHSNNPDPSMYRMVVFCDSLKTYVSHGSTTGDWTSFGETFVSGLSRMVQYTTSIHSATNHMIMELRIPLTFADLKSHMQGIIGFAINFLDGWTGMEARYSSDWDYKDPSTWGILGYSQVAIPEFSSALVMVLSLAIPFLVLWKKRKVI